MMTYNCKVRVYTLLVILIITTIPTAVIYAQKYKLNQRVEVNIDSKGVWYKGYVKDVQGFDNNNGYYLVHLDQGVAQYGGNTEFRITPDYYNLIRPEGSNNGINPANCVFGPPPGTFTNTSPPSVALFKRILYEKQFFFVNGRGDDDRPTRVGLTFLSFQNDKPYRNAAVADGQKNTMPINGAAPLNAAIYPATVKYIICEEHKVGIVRKIIESKHEFYIDKYGKWTSTDDPWKKVTKIE